MTPQLLKSVAKPKGNIFQLIAETWRLKGEVAFQKAK